MKYNSKLTKLTVGILATLVLTACGLEETTEKANTKEEVVEEEKEVLEVDINKDLELDNIVIELDRVYVEGGKLTFPFWWNHWATNDKIHLGVLAYPIVSQNGEELEYEDSGDTLLRQTEKGVDSRIELEYTLQDDSPVEIKFKTTADDPIEKSVSVDIK